MSKLNELQQRLAVASERNRQNEEKRDMLMKRMKDEFGCSTVEELEKVVEVKKADLAGAVTNRDAALERAEKAVSDVEAAVSGRTA